MTKVLGFILMMNTLLCCGHAEGANLTIDPNWSTFHPGESVTFTCDMNEGKDTDWEYEIRRNGEQFIQSDQHKSYTLQPIQIDHSGEYQCSGVRKSFSLTKCSGTVSLNVTAQPKAKLTAGPTTIPVGGSVTLSCSVEPSAGWKYRWWRRTSDTPEVQLTDENRDINVKQGGIYRCVGERGNTNFQSLVSDDVIITITFSNEVVVTRRPNWPQIFSGETITLTCEVQGGETTEWTCEWRRDRTTVARRNDKVWTVSVSESSSGDYMCQCRRRDDWRSVTKWSEKVPVSVSAQPRAKLTAGPTTIPVGGSVTLNCSVEPSAGWKYRWWRRTSDTPEVQLTDEENRDINVKQGGIYRCVGVRGNTTFHSVVSDEVNITVTFSNEVVVTRRPNCTEKMWPQMVSGETITLTCEVQGGETTEWTCEWKRDGTTVKVGNYKDLNVTVSESSTEEYMCQCRNRDDWYSVTRWSEKISVSVFTPGSSSSPVLMIVGPVSGILLVLLLVLLWYYRLSKDLRWPGWKLLKSRFRVNDGFNKNETDDSSSPLHGDDHIYESVNFSEPSGNGFKPRDVTYSLIELKNFGKDSTPNEPAEGAVYSCLDPGMEGRGSPGAKEEAVYSEINSGPENSNTM